MSQAERSRRYRRRHPDVSRARVAKYHTKYRVRLREAVIAYLGGRCIRCGYADTRALEIDHVSGDGRSDPLRRDAKGFHRAILAGRRDGRVQLLCANCNRLKRWEEGL